MFWRYLYRHGRQSPRQWLAFALCALRQLPTDGIRTFKRNKAYLAGLPVSEVEALARDFVGAEVVRRLYEPAVERLRRHSSRGDTVVLLSGTLDCIARPIGERLGVERICATLCEEDDGIYLGRLAKRHPYGQAKLDLTRQLAAELGYDLDGVVMYADSRHDVSVLEAVGRPVTVNPDRVLGRIAVRRGWEIL